LVCGDFMIDLQKLIADCDFHIKRGDNMSMPPKLLKELAERLLVEDEEFEQVNIARDFETEQVEAAKALQPAPEVLELVTLLHKACALLNEMMVLDQVDQYSQPEPVSSQDSKAYYLVSDIRAALAKNGGNNG